MRKLRSEHEGSISFTRVSASEIWSWAKENFKAIDNGQFEYEYNFLSERFLIKCMPTPTHDSLQKFFNRRVSVSLAAKVGIQQADALVEVGSGTSKLWNKSFV